MNSGQDFYIGLMSGTSSDAIDAALVQFSDSGCELVSTLAASLDASILERIQHAADGTADRISDVAELDALLAQAFADTALSLKAQAGVDQITAIGSHGQTVRHQPDGCLPYTVQLGSGARIAALTGITTVSDFRTADLALGGQGAPLVPTFHRAVFSDPDENRVIVNIGGIANATTLHQKDPLSGFDTGPGNTLMDHWFRRHQLGAYDLNGAWARSGRNLPKLLNALLACDFFSRPLPKSTGLDEFNLDWLNTHLTADERPEDVQATLVELTAESIAQSLKRNAPGTDAVYLCGGGANNEYLVCRLDNRITPLPLYTTDRLSLPVDWVEAVAFAWLAKERLKSQPTNCPEVTGSSRELALGAVYLG